MITQMIPDSGMCMVHPDCTLVPIPAAKSKGNRNSCSELSLSRFAVPDSTSLKPGTGLNFILIKLQVMAH